MALAIDFLSGSGPVGGEQVRRRLAVLADRLVEAVRQRVSSRSYATSST